MSTAAQILASTEIGTVRYIAGRPGSGVTTTLVEIANLALADDRPVLFLAAEASPERLRAHRGLSPEVEALDVMGIDDVGLADLIGRHGTPGGVVCVDHLGLIERATDTDALNTATRRSGVATIVGVPVDRNGQPMLRGRPSQTLVMI